MPRFGTDDGTAMVCAFHAFLPIDLIAVADGDFVFSFGFFLNVSHYTSLLVNQISVIADFSVIFLFSAFQKQHHS